MIRFALIAASAVGFLLTAALGNMLAPLQSAFKDTKQPESLRGSDLGGGHDESREEPALPPGALGGLCVVLGTLAAVGIGWFAACASEQELLGSGMTGRLLCALGGAMAFGAVGLADDICRLRARSPLGLRRGARLALEACAAFLAIAPMAAGGWLDGGFTLPGGEYVQPGGWMLLLWGLCLVALAECAGAADGADGTVCGMAFVSMLGLMFALTVLWLFPLAVLPAAAAGAAMAFLLWNFPPAKLRPGKTGCLFLAGAVGCIPMSAGRPELCLPLALPFWIEGGMVLLQIAFHRVSGGRLLFCTAPLHAWLSKRGVGAVGVFYIMCALAVLGSALAVRLTLLG